MPTIPQLAIQQKAVTASAQAKGSGSAFEDFRLECALSVMNARNSDPLPRPDS